MPLIKVLIEGALKMTYFLIFVKLYREWRANAEKDHRKIKHRKDINLINF